MGGALIASFVLAAAGAVANSEAQKSAAGERKRRQKRLFENQDRFSKQTQKELTDNLHKFNAQSEKDRTDKASETALNAINRVTKSTKPIKSGTSSLGVAGKTSNAKITKDASLIESEAKRNQLKNTALSNFLGIAGGQVKTGREFSNLGSSLNKFRTEARGQLGVDQASVLHSPKADTTLGDILSAAGTAVGIASGVSSITEASKEAAKQAAIEAQKQAALEAAKAGAKEVGTKAASSLATEAAKRAVEAGTTNALGQGSGTALQHFALDRGAETVGAGAFNNFFPEFFKVPLTQTGKEVARAPIFDSLGNAIAPAKNDIFKNFLTGL